MQPTAQISQPYSDSRAWLGQFGYRLQASGGNATLMGVKGNSSVPGGSLPFGTAYPVLDLSTIHGIDGSAADDGVVVNTRVSTFLYVYYCTQGFAAVNSPPLGFSTVAPTLSNGIYLLGSSGAAAGCMLIGWVFLNAAGAMMDTLASRTVVNYFNRRTQLLLLRPGYSDDNAETTFGLTANVYARINAGTGDTGQYIPNAEDGIQVVMRVALGAAGPASQVAFGIGDNSNTQPAVVGTIPSAAAKYTGTDALLSIGPNTPALRTLTMLGWTANLATTILADVVRNGAAADPVCTYLYALIPT